MNMTERDAQHQTVVVIGATRFLGRTLCSHLRSDGYRVLALSRSNGASHVCDVRNTESLASLIPSHALVINLAYMWHAGEPANREISRSVASACSRAGAARLVHCSTADVAGRAATGWINESVECRPFTEYGRTKLAMESDCRECTSDVVILRPTSVFGPGSHALAKLSGQIAGGSRVTDTLRRIAFGRRAMNLVSLENTIAAIRFAIDHPGTFEGRAFYVSDDDAEGNNFETVHEILAREIRGTPTPKLPAHAPPWMLGLALRMLRRNCVNPMVRYSGKRILEMGCPRPRNFLDAVRDYGHWYAQTVRQSQA